MGSWAAWAGGLATLVAGGTALLVLGLAPLTGDGGLPFVTAAGLACLAGAFAFIWFLRVGPAGAPARLLAWVLISTVLYATASSNTMLALIKEALSALGFEARILSALPLGGGIPVENAVLLALANAVAFTFWRSARR